MRYRFPLSALAPAAAPIFASAADTLKVPFEYHKLDNGLKVVLSKDTTAPTATVTVYYNIGFRIEPKGRTGFAHLFEHLMFQGSNLRESKGYTYSPFSQVSNRYRDATWAQNADVTTAVTGASLKEIFYEIDRLQAEAPTEAELESAKNYMLGTFVLRNSDRFGIIAQLEFINFHGLPADYLNTYIGKVRAVTPAQVQQIAQKYIDDTKTAIIAVGDKKLIEDQVKAFGPIWSTTL